MPDKPFIFPHDGQTPAGVRALPLGPWNPKTANLRSFTGVNNPQVSEYTVGDKTTGFPVLFDGAQSLRQIVKSMPSSDPSKHSELVHYPKLWGPGDIHCGGIALYFPSNSGWESRKGSGAWHVLAQDHNVDDLSPSWALERRGSDLGCIFSIRDGGTNSPYHAKELDMWHVWTWSIECVDSGLGQVKIYYGKNGAKPTLFHTTSQKNIRRPGDYTYFQCGWYSYTSGFPLTFFRHLPIVESCDNVAQVEALMGISGTVIPAPNDTQAPTITNLMAIPSGDLKSVELTSTVNDNVGVKSVTYHLDGTLVGVDTSAPWTATATLANPLIPGVHSVEAAAVDDAGNQSTATYDFTIEEPPPPPPDVPTVLDDLEIYLTAIKNNAQAGLNRIAQEQ